MNLKKYKILKNRIGNITTNFGDKTRDENFHEGIDIANATGTPIPALKDGIITDVGTTQNGLGNIVRLKDTDGSIHQYAHLKKALVKPGMKVKSGQEIAQMGSSGNSYSPSGGDPSHTDIRIVNAYGKYINPKKYLK